MTFEQFKKSVENLPDTALPLAIAYAEGFRSGVHSQKEQNNGHFYSDSSNDSRIHRDREEVTAK